MRLLQYKDLDLRRALVAFDKVKAVISHFLAAMSHRSSKLFTYP